jgi:hypothetical protein
VVELLDQINRKELWNARGITKSELWHRIQFTSHLRPMVDFHSVNDKRKQRSMEALEQTWGGEWEEEIDPHGTLLPPRRAQKFLQNLARIATKLSTSEFVAKAKTRISDRLTVRTVGNRTDQGITHGDLERIWQEVCDMSDRKRLRIEDSEKEVCVDANLYQAQEDAEDSEIDDDDDDEEEDEDGEEESENESRGLGLVPVPRDICNCPNSVNAVIKRKIQEIQQRKGKNPTMLMRDLEWAEKHFQKSLCFHHTKMLGSGLGLTIGGKTKRRLQQRIGILVKNRYGMGDFKILHSGWFKKTVRPHVESDDLGPFKFLPQPPSDFTFNRKQVFTRIAGPIRWDELERDGHTVVEGQFDWIIKDQKIMAMVKDEINMYLYHRRRINDKANYGWVRNSYHSLAQQAIRQDPLYYALVCSSRLDTNYRQISFPYYMKAVLPGDNIFFRHVDLNIPKYLETGRGMQRIQTSLSLTQETATNCTVVIPGFHKKIDEWWAKVVERNHDICAPGSGKGGRERLKKFLETGERPRHEGNCMRVDKIYRPEDRRDFGDWVPAICPPGGLRISRPEILHGSASLPNGRADCNRWVLNPWFVGIQKDHSALDIPECGTWEAVSAAHRDLEALPSTPSGQTNTHGHPKSRFPPAVEFRGFSALSDALIGQRKYNSPAVMEEVRAVLGPHDGIAREYITMVRERIVNAWEEAFELLREAEMGYYGENSYFYLLEEGRPPEIVSEDALASAAMDEEEDPSGPDSDDDIAESTVEELD